LFGRAAAHSGANGPLKFCAMHTDTETWLFGMVAATF